MGKLVDMMEKCGFGLTRHSERNEVKRRIHKSQIMREFKEWIFRLSSDKLRMTNLGALSLYNAISQGALKRTLCVVDSSPFFKRLRMTSGRAFLRTAPRYAFSAFALAFLLLTPNSAKAEQSGWFVGVQAGYGRGERHREREAAKTSAGTTTFSDYYFADSTGTRRNVIQEQDASNDSGVASGTYYDFDPTDNQITWKSGRAAERNKIGSIKLNRIFSYQF